MGINAPRAHQRLIAQLTANLLARFHAGSIAFEPLPETMIDESQSSPVPDIILVDEVNDTVPIIIEKAHGAGVRNDLDTIRHLISTTNYGIQEGFIYDYKRLRWYKFDKNLGDVLSNPSFSTALHLDLNELI